MSLEVVHSIAELRESWSQLSQAGKSIGLVPTMGALHAGHARLIEQARGEADCVVVSLFVNPAQFDRGDDYQSYPRSFSADREFCGARGVDMIFAPSVEAMYHGQEYTFVEVPGVSEHLCGAFRPGHFRGVATVVLKLLNIVRPTWAYFGEKDAQQLAVIRRMVEDLNLAVVIREVPTVREADGLAVSSRNQLLSPEQRQMAPLLYQALQVAERCIAGGVTDSEVVKREALKVFQQQPQVVVQYFEIVDPREMKPVERITAAVRVAGAVLIGSIRLIDNILVPSSKAVDCGASGSGAFGSGHPESL